MARAHTRVRTMVFRCDPMVRVGSPTRTYLRNRVGSGRSRLGRMLPGTSWLAPSPRLSVWARPLLVPRACEDLRDPHLVGARPLPYGFCERVLEHIGRCEWRAPPGSPTDHAVRPRVCGRVPLVDRRERRVLSGRQPPWFARSVRRDGFGPELIAPRLQLVNVDRGPHAHRPPSAVAGLVVEKLCPVCSADDHRGARDRHVETSVRRTICVDALFAAPPQIDLRTLANAEVSYRNASGSFQCLQCHAVWQSDTYVDIDGLAAWSAPCPACGLYVLRELANLHHSQRAARVDPDRALLGALQEHLRAHGFRYSEIAHLTPDGEGGSVAKQRRRVEDRLRKRRTRQ